MKNNYYGRFGIMPTGNPKSSINKYSYKETKETATSWNKMVIVGFIIGYILAAVAYAMFGNHFI